MKKSKWLLIFLKKIAIFFISIWVLSAVVFALSRVTPIDPLQSYYGERVEKMSEEQKNSARERLGLSESIPVQYVRWLKLALSGDFGISYKYKQDAVQVIKDRIGNTLLLGGTSYVILFIGALLVGLLCAWKENSLFDRLMVHLGTVMSCIPEFWMSLILIFVFSVLLGWFPASGAYTIGGGGIMDRIRHLVLPLIACVSGHLWYYAYMVRNMLCEQTRSDYVLLARAKGIADGVILIKHCLKNVLPTYISLMAVSVAHILGGTYLVESVFGYPGIGMLTYESAKTSDYNMLMVLCLLTGIIMIAANTAAELINVRLNPQLNRSSEGIEQLRKNTENKEKENEQIECILYRMDKAAKKWCKTDAT